MQRSLTTSSFCSVADLESIIRTAMDCRWEEAAEGGEELPAEGRDEENRGQAVEEGIYI